MRKILIAVAILTWSAVGVLTVQYLIDVETRLAEAARV